LVLDKGQTYDWFGSPFIADFRGPKINYQFRALIAGISGEIRVSSSVSVIIFHPLCPEFRLLNFDRARGSLRS
jgi:hypothetical protein